MFLLSQEIGDQTKTNSLNVYIWWSTDEFFVYPKPEPTEKVFFGSEKVLRCSGLKINI